MHRYRRINKMHKIGADTRSDKQVLEVAQRWFRRNRNRQEVAITLEGKVMHTLTRRSALKV